jgi:hypothetical protein
MKQRSRVLVFQESQLPYVLLDKSKIVELVENKKVPSHETMHTEVNMRLCCLHMQVIITALYKF